MHLRWDPNTAKSGTLKKGFTKHKLPQKLIPDIFLYNFNELIVLLSFRLF